MGFNSGFKGLNAGETFLGHYYGVLLLFVSLCLKPFFCHHICVSEEILINTTMRWGHVVAQLFEALRYKPEGRGFDSRWCHWNFSLT